MAGRTIEVVCACGCGQRFVARVADRKRGWGRFASKSCKAREQERRTHQFARMNGESIVEPINFGCWDEHKEETASGWVGGRAAIDAARAALGGNNGPR